MKRALFIGLLITFFPTSSGHAMSAEIPSDPNAAIFQHLKDVGILKPDLHGQLQLDRFATRAEALTVALRAGNIGINQDFDIAALPLDVDPNAWYAPVVARARETRIFIPHESGFRPNDIVSKAEFLAMLLRATKIDLRPYSNRVQNIASDIPEDAWFARHFAYVKQYQIAHLPSDLLYRPFKGLTRREIGLFTYRQLRIFHGDESVKTFAELQAQMEQFLTLLRSQEDEKAEQHLPRILELTRTLAQQKNDTNAVAAFAMSKALTHFADGVRSLKYQRTLSGIENLHLAIKQASRAGEKSERMATFASQLTHVIEEMLRSL